MKLECKLFLEAELLLSGIFHSFGLVQILIWITLIVQIRFDETADYFDRAKKVSLRSITILIFVILGIELTLILG